MRKFLLLIIPVLTGCFKDEPKLPQFYAEQEVDVAVDSMICFSGQEDFDQFLISCSESFDSVHWYANYLNPIFLGNEQPLEFSVNPWVHETIRCLGFNGTDTTEHEVRLNYCSRYMYIPLAFTPNQDGINDTWYPVYYSTDDGVNFQPYSINWEIRTQDGIKIYEASDAYDGWDGDFMPSGIYFYYIELLIESEQPIEYTGSLNLIK